MDGWVLAIDFGTSFTTAAVLAGGRAELLEIDNSRYLPSLVFIDDNGEPLVGRHAVNRAEVFPERAERCPKRALVTTPAVRLGDRDVPVVDLVAAVLARAYQEAVRLQGGRPPERVVLTHPARWGSEDLRRLGEAAAKAGLPYPWFESEPVAAAAYYAARGRIDPGQCVAVYDLGGGTFDTAVLRRTEEGFTECGPPGGHDQLGGEDFDAALLELVGEHAARVDREAWDALAQGTDRIHRRGRARLQRDVREAKHVLSERLSAEVLPDGFDDELRVTRAEFEERIMVPLQESLAELQATISRAGLTPDELAAVYLTGGSSRIPKVSDLIAETFGRMPVVEGDPKGVVALGALHSYMAAATRSAASSSDRAEQRTPGGESASFGQEQPAAETARSASSGGRRRRDGRPKKKRGRRVIAVLLLVAVAVAGYQAVRENFDTGGYDSASESTTEETSSPEPVLTPVTSPSPESSSTGGGGFGDGGLFGDGDSEEEDSESEESEDDSSFEGDDFGNDNDEPNRLDLDGVDVWTLVHGGLTYRLGVLDDGSERAQGLAGWSLSELGSLDGVIYVYPPGTIAVHQQYRMRFPVDLVFFDAHGFFILGLHGVQPCQSEPCPQYYPVNRTTRARIPFSYVLEIPTARDRYHFRVGERINVPF